MGSLLASVTIQTPTGQEQLAILSQTHPLLAPLLPPALATLSLIRLAAGQATADNSTEWSAAEVSPYPYSTYKRHKQFLLMSLRALMVDHVAMLAVTSA